MDVEVDKQMQEWECEWMKCDKSMDYCEEGSECRGYLLIDVHPYLREEHCFIHHVEVSLVVCW